MQENQPDKQKQFLMDFISGGLAGAVAKTVCAPIERVKLLMQTQAMNKKLDKAYKGIGDCFMRCVREDGPLSLWRGNWVNVIRYFPTQALNFSFKDRFASFFNAKRHDLSHGKFLFNNILAGGFAGCSTSLFVYPLDTARTRLGVDLGKSKDQRQFTGFTDVFKKIHAKDGIKGLYQGLGICLIGVFLYRGVQFGCYDTGKELILDKNSGFVKRFLFAQIIVILSETISYPTDTLKRRLMMQSGDIKVYKNSLQLFNHIKKNEGVFSLMNGCASNIFRSVGSSLCLLIYDEMKKLQKYAH